MSTSADVRDAILDIMAERLRLDEPTVEQLRINGRLDAVTAADSILVVELVLGLRIVSESVSRRTTLTRS